jgi:hypothetical protein
LFVNAKPSCIGWKLLGFGMFSPSRAGSSAHEPTTWLGPRGE